MSASELEGLIIANTSPLLGNETKLSLIDILRTSETEATLQIRSIPVTPTTDPFAIQEQVSSIRTEMLAEAIMSFLNSMQASMVSATSVAVDSYLQAHATAVLVPGSLVVPNPPGIPIPVVATGPISTIPY